MRRFAFGLQRGEPGSPCVVLAAFLVLLLLLGTTTALASDLADFRREVDPGQIKTTDPARRELVERLWGLRNRLTLKVAPTDRSLPDDPELKLKWSDSEMRVTRDLDILRLAQRLQSKVIDLNGTITAAQAAQRAVLGGKTSIADVKEPEKKAVYAKLENEIKQADHTKSRLVAKQRALPSRGNLMRLNAAFRNNWGSWLEVRPDDTVLLLSDPRGEQIYEDLKEMLRHADYLVEKLIDPRFQPSYDEKKLEATDPARLRVGPEGGWEDENVEQAMMSRKGFHQIRKKLQDHHAGKGISEEDREAGKKLLMRVMTVAISVQGQADQTAKATKLAGQVLQPKRNVTPQELMKMYDILVDATGAK